MNNRPGEVNILYRDWNGVMLFAKVHKLIAVCMYRYVITKGLRSKYDVDGHYSRFMARILVNSPQYKVTLLCYISQLYCMQTFNSTGNRIWINCSSRHYKSDLLYLLEMKLIAQKTRLSNYRA